MIKLEGNDYRLIKKLEKKNNKNYQILELDDEYYIRYYDLFCCLDDTADNRDYAEQKLIEIAEDYDSKKEDNIPGLQKSLQMELYKLKKENEKLKENLEAVTGTFNEDQWDMAFERGLEI